MTPRCHAQLACLWEATARKLGNVHPSASFADVEFSHFLASALCLNWSAPSLGDSIVQAVQATRASVRTNTNLGIVLLVVPLVAAAERGDLRSEITRVLATTTRADASAVFRAIRTAAPGGLGQVATQDVHGEPDVTLLEAMAIAADRDQIARQYVTQFQDVLDFGVPALESGWQQFGCVEAAILAAQLAWLSRFPDSLIARKCGRAAAEEVRERAREVLRRGGLATRPGRLAAASLDRHLRSDGHRLNPGTTADLITASLFVALHESRLQASAPFLWLDWPEKD